MTETKILENPTNSMDVKEFKEDEPTEIAVKQTSPIYGHSHAAKVSGTEMQYQEIQTEICRGVDAANIDCNHDNTGSFSLIDNNDLAVVTEPTHVLHNGFKSDGQDAEIISNVIQSESGFAIAECGSGLHTTAQLDCHLNSAVQETSCNDMPFRLTTDAEENMGQRSPSAATTSSDGPSSHNCFSGDAMWQETNVGIVLSPDYLQYGGAHFVDSVVSFSRRSIEARGRRVYEKEGSFHIHLDASDVVKIESQWSSRYDTGTLNICFILKYAAEDNVPHNTGLQELKFPVVDWYKKREAIESLNDRYRAIWSSRLDTGLENCSVLPEGEAVVPTRSYFPKFDKPFEEVIYPKGDPDAVSLSKRDVDLLLPDTFVNDTIIDFYIKYLKTKQNEERRNKFHFFNSFFFRKLADMDKDPSSAFDGKAAFQRVRKWTRKVNLLEKDFIFIPVNYNYHWSLIVICYLGEVANYEDVENGRSTRVPCILHMDSFKGNHLGLKDLIQSYLWEEWKERQKGTCDELYAKFKNLKFIPLELPQQPNLYDCGLFLLHYVERFLEDVPENFSIYNITPSTHFLQVDWFPPGEASLKRTHIEKLINHLIETRSENCTPSDGSSMHSSPECPNATNGLQNGGDFSLKSGPSNGCHENSLQIGHGIEMTLLPSSSTMSNLCTTTSAFVLKDLFEPLPASESLNNAHWGSLENKSSSFLDFNSHVTLSEEKMETGECFVPTDLSEPVFHHLDGINPEAHSFTYSCGDFASEPIPQPTQDNTDSSPVASGELLNASIEHNDCDRITLLANNSFSIEHPQEANHSFVPAALSCGDEPDLSEPKTLNQLDLSISQAGHPQPRPHTVASKRSPVGDDGIDDEPVPESDEQHATKKMRMTPLDDGGEGDASKDLTL